MGQSVVAIRQDLIPRPSIEYWKCGALFADPNDFCGESRLAGMTQAR